MLGVRMLFLFSMLINSACLYLTVYHLLQVVSDENYMSSDFMLAVVLIPFFLYLAYMDILLYDNTVKLFESSKDRF